VWVLRLPQVAAVIWHRNLQGPPSPEDLETYSASQTLNQMKKNRRNAAGSFNLYRRSPFS
jgi:hypothetical protein